MRRYWNFLASLVLISIFTAGASAGPKPRTVDGQSSPSSKEQQAPLRKQRVEGRVESIKGQTATIKTREGRRVDVNLGPKDYWDRKGYELKEGQPVTVDGFCSDGNDGPFFAGGIWGPGFHFEMTNDRGYPYWADPDGWYDGWYPRVDYYAYYWGLPRHYYYGAPPWFWGAPPPYWGPPPPRWDRHHRHYRGHDGHGRYDQPGPPPEPRHGRGRR